MYVELCTFNKKIVQHASVVTRAVDAETGTKTEAV